MHKITLIRSKPVGGPMKDRRTFEVSGETDDDFYRIKDSVLHIKTDGTHYIFSPVNWDIEIKATKSTSKMDALFGSQRAETNVPQMWDYEYTKRRID